MAEPFSTAGLDDLKRMVEELQASSPRLAIDPAELAGAEAKLERLQSEWDRFLLRGRAEIIASH